MTDLIQRARDVAGRLTHCSANTRDEYLHELAGRSAAIIAELVERVEGMRDALGNIARDSNPDWTENRVYPQDVLDEVNRMAVEAYYAPPSVLGKQEGEG